MASHVANKLVVGLGSGLIIFSFYIFVRLFHDPIKQEIRYSLSKYHEVKKLTPPNTDFSLVVEKIGATSTIVPNVDPFNSLTYQKALARGIAHAQGTKLPGQGGNIFLFAHSSADLLTAERYNSIFYLMHRLEVGDVIKVWSKGKEYDYVVSDKKFVAPSNTQYLTAQTSEQLTLMTCWPPGTTLKRLIIVAKPSVL